MSLAAAAPVKVSRIRQHRQANDVAIGIADIVAAFHLLDENIKACSGHPRCGAGKTTFDDIVGEPHGFEDLCTFVRLER